MSQFVTILTRAVRSGTLLCSFLCAPFAVASASLWSSPSHQSPPSEAAPAAAMEKGASAFGIDVGEEVTFRGVGTVFYAGYAGGDVYFSEADEPGVFDWEGAIAACAMKGPGWSLPSAEQLVLLYSNADEINLHAKEIRNTQGFWYWSSSSGNTEFALRVRAFDGLQQDIKKKFSARVRCVRVH